jgi:hypothetical protein
MNNLERYKSKIEKNKLIFNKQKINDSISSILLFRD